MPMGTITLDRIDTMPPTRQCLVCERKENPKAVMVYTNASWLCDKCRAALLKVVESEDTE